jgi:hypothetical protein
MNVDPEWPRFLRDVVEQETQRPKKNDQRCDGPMEGDGGRAIPRKRRGDALPGRENVHGESLLDFFIGDGPTQASRRLVQSPGGVFVARWIARGFERSLGAAMLART